MKGYFIGYVSESILGAGSVQMCFPRKGPCVMPTLDEARKELARFRRGDHFAGLPSLGPPPKYDIYRIEKLKEGAK
jgi:hypothetical protein